ncbi:hypothetical protein [Natrinema limicola]|nr:hypothetical protein [Natrinema limicola]
MAAIERFLKSRNKRVPDKDENFEMKVVEKISEGTFIDLINQYKYAGRQTINYFIITGISDYNFDEIKENVANRFPEQDDISNPPVTKEPFLAASDVINSRLYLPISYYVYAGSEHPVTGTKQGIPITKRTVVVIHEDRDLVEIRGSDVDMVENIRDEFCKSLGKYKTSVKDRPSFGARFQEKFNNLVDTYFNLKVRVDDQEDSSLDTISFTSKEDEQGNRQDAREDERVEKELSERGGEITMGYVEVEDGFRFRMNRENSKISFMKSEKEENLNSVTDIVHNVLRKTGRYTQGQISGVSDVPQ